MNRIWTCGLLIAGLVAVLLSACAQDAARGGPSAEKPVEKTAVQPAGKPASAPAAKGDVKPETPKGLPSTIGIGTAASGTGYHSAGGGIAKVASDHTPIKVLLKPYAGPNAWIPLVDKGELELGVAAGMSVGWAYNGETGFNTRNRNLRVLMQGNWIQAVSMVVRADSDIKSIKDLRGRRVQRDFGGNTLIQASVTAYLESAGLSWNDVRAVPVSDVNSSLRALREGRADVAFGGAPSSALTQETDAAIGLRALNFGDVPPERAEQATKEFAEVLGKYMPASTVARMRKSGWLKADATVLQYPIYLVAAAGLSADAAYIITKALYENDTGLQSIYVWLKDWKKDTMFGAQPPAPYHEGAVRFWKEKGSWSADAEANQKKLLAQ
ncbi:MAG: TAXI family TRAP transporter solute-binding subunit [Chloroflexi bacterium]|nr:TAXI family TRAP transporter solute-binding subunit [Chloroflexota bacterium]